MFMNSTKAVEVSIQAVLPESNSAAPAGKGKPADKIAPQKPYFLKPNRQLFAFAIADTPLNSAKNANPSRTQRYCKLPAMRLFGAFQPYPGTSGAPALCTSTDMRHAAVFRRSLQS
ncbi:hypothetical protein [Methylogaea oryzae]|uniref:Uncharacterized protein n=1 Tax=Methylogaea oryzae TaxID=1295382 RepID=A0A8D4VKP8_9GAMM|nr:hypothetical protein [Methylogaea oryzae]BBL69530.1 hypothetical protein MoryE10_01360 [Methylogaea oryzae]